MNKIYHYAVPTPKQGRIIDARNPNNWIEVGSIEVYPGMTDEEMKKTLQECGIPDNAIVLWTETL